MSIQFSYINITKPKNKNLEKYICTWKRGFHSHTYTPSSHRSWSELSNPIGLRISSNTCRTSTSSHRVFGWNASLFRWGRRELSTGRGGRSSSQGKYTPSSSPLCSIFASVSTEGCGPSDEAVNSGLSGSPCCISRRRIGLWPLGSSETKQQPQHLDLFTQRNQIKNLKPIKENISNSNLELEEEDYEIFIIKKGKWASLNIACLVFLVDFSSSWPQGYWDWVSGC